MYFFYELADGFHLLASKPNSENAEDGGWHMREGTRSCFRCVGGVCLAIASGLDHLQIWRYRMTTGLALRVRASIR